MFPGRPCRRVRSVAALRQADVQAPTEEREGEKRTASHSNIHPSHRPVHERAATHPPNPSAARRSPQHRNRRARICNQSIPQA